MMRDGPLAAGRHGDDRIRPGGGRSTVMDEKQPTAGCRQLGWRRRLVRRCSSDGEVPSRQGGAPGVTILVGLLSSRQIDLVSPNDVEGGVLVPPARAPLGAEGRDRSSLHRQQRGRSQCQHLNSSLAPS